MNDATVLATTITRGSDAINIDGSPASGWDKGFAVAGAFLPVVSGSAVKSALKAGGELAQKYIQKGVKLIDDQLVAADATFGKLKLKDSHHIIQDKAVQKIANYNSGKAPAVLLDDPSRVRGTPHNKATVAQRQTAGGGTYASERRFAYRALRAAGMSPETTKKLVREADKYFESLGVTMTTPTEIPKNRKK